MTRPGDRCTATIRAVVDRPDGMTAVAAIERSEETERLRATLASIAPGTPLRDALERILRGRTGALVVLGYDKTVEGIATGGFQLDVPFTATGLRELAKMDGAIIVDGELTRIHKAAVHLMPDHTIPSEETGTRHRTADRVARQTGFPVISVSQSMQIIAAYVGETRHVLEDSGRILTRANQALATLERYKMRLDEVSSTLSALEIEDLVTVRDVAVVAQRLEMVTRIAREIEDYVLELGTDGRLLTLQLEELITGVDAERELVIRDYLPGGRKAKTPEELLLRLEHLDASELVDPAAVAKALGLGSAEHLDGAVTPRGFRLLAKVPRLPAAVVDRLIDHFGTLQKLLGAGIDDLQAVEGVGELRARSVREGLSRLAESSILERYV
ncbi:DNA integrity scanning protein DisA [Nocardioides jejuensis]|uniref:DNA integrity scanning protein DisA n=2 Tax=Nocardioides jejuensis TaxID=2502782 RepID=A0A4R1C2G7_9ACTN|nr:DNA integrity scanning protein DisA [Nocardioides jejuensis]